MGATAIDFSRTSANALRRFETAFAAHRDAVFDFALRIVKDPALAEDVAQQAFLRAYLHADDWSEQNARMWLLRKARNQSLELLRERKRRAAREAKVSAAA